MSKQKPGLTVTVEVDDFTRDLLTGAGWTPPGVISDPNAWVTTEHHDKALRALEDDHRRSLARREVAEVGARREAAQRIRREVAEEIAKDLERPREWRISTEDPTPWARVARKHAGGEPAAIEHEHVDTTVTVSGSPAEVFSLRMSTERVRQLRQLARKRQGASFGVTVLARAIIYGALDQAIANGEIRDDTEVCTLCSHHVDAHGRGGCWAPRVGDNGLPCDCVATHNRMGTVKA